MPKNKDMYSNLTDMSYLLDPDAMDNDSEKEGDSETIIKISDLLEFKDHPFNVNTGSADFEELVESIKENGLIYPILVRPVDDKYEIISGHRRVAACKAAGLNEVSAIVRPLDDYEATILMVHSNLYRPEISISEKANAYRMCMEAEKHQGIKGVDTAAAIGEEVSDSRAKVYRYIRLSFLQQELLKMVDEKKLTINAGIELSYLDEAAQDVLWNFVTSYDIVPSNEQASAIRKEWNEEKHISKEFLISVLIGKEKKVARSFSLKKKEINEYFDADCDSEYVSKVIHTLLRKYKDGELKIEI